MSHLRCTTVALALLLHACGPSATERCAAISGAAMAYETALGFEGLAVKAGEDSAEASGLRIGLARAKVQDAVTWRHRAAYGAKDSMQSMLTGVIPPSPADQAWYADACWQGRPR